MGTRAYQLREKAHSSAAKALAWVGVFWLERGVQKPAQSEQDVITLIPRAVQLRFQDLMPSSRGQSVPVLLPGDFCLQQDSRISPLALVAHQRQWCSRTNLQEGRVGREILHLGLVFFFMLVVGIFGFGFFFLM